MLTQAALASADDRLVGLKENVILGRLIPAGTGFKRYQDLTLTYEGDPARPAPAFVEVPADAAAALRQRLAETLAPSAAGQAGTPSMTLSSDAPLGTSRT